MPVPERQVDGPSPGPPPPPPLVTPPPPPPPQGARQGKRSIVPVVATASVLLVAVLAAVAWWLFDSKQANEPDLVGDWRGSYFVEGATYDVSAVITESNPIRGEATYEGCRVSWTEISRSGSVIRVDEQDITSNTECSGEVELTVSDGTIEGAFHDDAIGTFVMDRI